MSQNANTAEPCDVKGHLKDQGVILLNIIAAALGAAAICAAILGIGWLIATNETFKETLRWTILGICGAIMVSPFLALLSYALYKAFEPTINLAKCLYKANRQSQDN